MLTITRSARSPLLKICAALACAAVSASAALIKDVVYGTAGAERLLLDAHVPDSPGPHPVAILIHGGGWEHGDKGGSDVPGNPADISPWFEPLSAANFTWFSVNYRLIPKGPWPDAFEDVEAAVRWIKLHAAEYRGDPDRVVIFGHSAGGNLAGLIATCQTPATRVQAAVLFAPSTDFPWEKPVRPGHGLYRTAVSLIYPPRGMPAEVFAAVRDPWPLDHINARMPPVLLVCGDQDRTVPIHKSELFLGRLRAAGIPSDLIVIHGGPHSIVLGTRIDPSYRPKMLAWIARTLETGPAEPHPERRLTVAADGTADFRSIREALASLAGAPAGRTTLLLKEGVYRETLRLDRAGVSLIGESRWGTRIKSGGQPQPTVEIDAPDCAVENLSVENHSSGVAPALAVAADAAVVEDCDLLGSGAETLQVRSAVSRLKAARLTIAAGQTAIGLDGGGVLADSMVYSAGPGQRSALSRVGARGRSFEFRNCRFEGQREWRLIRGPATAPIDFIGCRFAPTLVDEAPRGAGIRFSGSQGKGRDYGWLNNAAPAAARP